MAVGSKHPAKTRLVCGLKQKQKGSQVEEGELERLTMRGKGLRQHALPGYKRRREPSVQGPPDRPHLSYSQGRGPNFSGMTGRPTDLVLVCVSVCVVIFVCLCMLQF